MNPLKTIKPQLVPLATALVALMIGCSSPRPPGHSAATDPRVGDIIVDSARFGNGPNSVDVTTRVIELLHSEPKGFAANADRMGVDPQPYKAKTLAIIYHYKGAERVFAITSPGKVSYELLLKNSEVNR